MTDLKETLCRSGFSPMQWFRSIENVYDNAGQMTRVNLAWAYLEMADRLGAMS